LCRRLGGVQGWTGQVRKNSPPPEFDSRTVQSVASLYTDYATQPTDKVRNVSVGVVGLKNSNSEFPVFGR
jgi:hypothetical protein